MCVLIISNFLRALDHARFVEVSKSVQARIDEARLQQRAVAFVQNHQSAGFDEMGVRIGRYDPIFRMQACEDTLPTGLTDFIVRHSPMRVSVLGMTTRQQFLRITQTLGQAGISAGGEANAILLSAGAPAPAKQQDQFNEYDALAWRRWDGSASKKNQSTRWPRA
ncbi:MAG: hypothetical protein AAGJ68_15275 [Pseudomonadota bacterium]